MEGLDEGANVADPAEQQEPDQQNTATETQPETEATTQPMPKGQRHNYAAARRESEALLNDYKHRADSFAKANGFDTFEEMEKSTRDERLHQAGLDEDVITPLISEALASHPMFKAMQEAEVSNIVDQQLRAFQAAYPDAGITSVEDFTKLPTYDKFYDYVTKGLSYQDAYELSNRDSLRVQRTAAAKQAARNSAAGKDHMRSDGGSGAPDSDITVPAETRAMYKRLLGWDDKTINSHYAKLNK